MKKIHFDDYPNGIYAADATFLNELQDAIEKEIADEVTAKTDDMQNQVDTFISDSGDTINETINGANKQVEEMQQQVNKAVSNSTSATTLMEDKVNDKISELDTAIENATGVFSGTCTDEELQQAITESD